MQGLTRTTLIALVTAVLMVLVGLIFIGQGLGIITGRSIMVGDRTWAVIGALLVLAGAWIGRRAWIRRNA
jgi:hypothetical protein